MLAGIGGRTVAEAQQRLSYPEFLRWRAYRRQHGSLNTAERVERAVAVLSAMYINTKRKPGTEPLSHTEFTPHHHAKPISLDEAMATWE